MATDTPPEDPVPQDPNPSGPVAWRIRRYASGWPVRIWRAITMRRWARRLAIVLLILVLMLDGN